MFTIGVVKNMCLYLIKSVMVLRVLYYFDSLSDIVSCIIHNTTSSTPLVNWIMSKTDFEPIKTVET